MPEYDRKNEFGNRLLINYYRWSGHFHFGCNNSATYQWVTTTESLYYVDDLIINGSRIGPRYFALLNSTQDTTSPQPPGGLKVK